MFFFSFFTFKKKKKGFLFFSRLNPLSHFNYHLQTSFSKKIKINRKHRLVDFELGVRLVLALAVSLYVGDALKDLVCAPRPLAMARELEEQEEEGEALNGDDGDGDSGSKPRRRRRQSGGRKTPPALPPPPKIRLLTADPSGASERRSLLEYGFPSSHVMNSLVLSLHAVECCRQSRFLSLLPPSMMISVFSARAVAVLWTLLVALARVACGMHSPVDVAGGLLSGLLVVAALALEDIRSIGGGGGEGGRSTMDGSGPSSSSSSLDARYIGWLAARGTPAAALHLLATALLLRLHPLPLRYTTSFEATTAFAGACAGVALGVSLGGGGGGGGVGGGGAPPLSVSVSSSSSSFLLLLAALRRLAAGLAAVAAVKEVSKRLVLALVPLPYRALPLRLRRLWQPPVRSLSRDERMERLGIPVDASGRPWDEVLTAKFFSYAALGWAVAGLAPAGFAATGI